MKKTLLLLFLMFTATFSYAAENKTITVSTDVASLIFKVGDNGRLYQIYLGKKLVNSEDIAALPTGTEAYITSGMEDYFEPAIHIVHNDGNPSLLLKYVSHTVNEQASNISETTITLQDDKYPITVLLHFIAYKKENIIKTFTEIKNQEKKPIQIHRYASSMLHFNSKKYFLTEFTGGWGDEATITEQELSFGKKVIDTKLGARANMFVSPFFQLSLNEKSRENEGEVVVGTLGWTGNFQFTFEVDNDHKLRIISGINPYASEYDIKNGETFRTPDFYFTYSLNGKGQASRNFHDWARKYQLKDGEKTRMTLLNNWEATYFRFDENKLSNLMGEAAQLGVDMFLLDDGWFGNKYPRKNDSQGLGDWTVTKEKLPNGIEYLVKEAEKNGIKFGLWIEPEMVSPKSELYEKHKNWVIHLPNRDEYYFRHQMVLDLSNPDVQDYVYSIVDDLMTKNPGIAFFKWDCNSPITNIYSDYLKDKQSHLYIDYVRGLYNVLERIKQKYPSLPMMLCSGGGGRTDYEALKYFTEFWPSDNTNPVERLYIQWGFSQIFPSKAICAHVTSWNKTASIKFRTDVAMMGKLGFDIRLTDLNDDDRTFCHDAVANYNNLKPIILEGDMYRLASPYEGQHTATMYVGKDKKKAVFFAFDINPRYGERIYPVRLQGLDETKSYTIKEINMMPGQKSTLNENEKTLSGNFLMTVGLNVFTNNQMRSVIIEINEK